MTQVRAVTIKRLAEITGYTEDAIRSKIDRGQWIEGWMFLKAPDGRLHIDVENYERWVRGEPLVALRSERAPSGSRLSGSAIDTSQLSEA